MEKQETIGARLRASRKAKGLSLQEVGQRLGVSAQAVQQWEKNRTAPDAARLSALSRLLEIGLTWLLTGHGSLEDIGTQPGPQRGRTVPRVSMQDLSLGNMVAAQTYVTTHFPCSPQAFAIILEDASGEPEFRAGDTVVIDPNILAAPGDMILAIVRGGALFRRIRFLSQMPMRFILEPINMLWAAEEASDISVIIGVMSEHTRPRRR